jgi:predicted RNA-binding Zn ribbon-like protein
MMVMLRESTAIVEKPMTFRFLGGALCLDFANTVAWRRAAEPEERLRTYEELLLWASEARLVRSVQRQTLHAIAAKRRRDANAAFHRALDLRDAVYKTFAAIARNQEVEQMHLDVVNAEIACAFVRLRVGQEPERFVWKWDETHLQLDRVLWPIAKSASDLLISGDLTRLRECESPDGCGWLFLDTSRNRSRRWCDMRDCGNRVKVRRYYQRKRLDSRRQA